MDEIIVTVIKMIRRDYENKDSFCGFFIIKICSQGLSVIVCDAFLWEKVVDIC